MLSPHRYCTATSGTIGSTGGGDCSSEEGARWLLLPNPLWPLTPPPLPPLNDDDDENDEEEGDDASELIGMVHRSVCSR